ncbi:MAG: hypothetical protein JKX85_05370 [Phycisphaeraceae bacterium]|nr:hypothetical protein [Phycisphaeraceae bacterium]
MTEHHFSEYLQSVTQLVNDTPNNDNIPDDLKALVTVSKLMIQDNPDSYQTLIDGLANLAAGQSITSLPKRPVYPLLTLHVHLAAFKKRYLNLPDSIWDHLTLQFDQLATPLRQIEIYRNTPPPHMSTEIVLWQASCLLLMGTLRHIDGDIELAMAVIQQIVDRIVPDNPLTKQDPEESLDGWTYRELLGIHALTNAALLVQNTPWAQRIEQIALYHLYHTQPDHCTSEPWGVFGFLWSSQTHMFAIQQIHDAKAYGLVGVSRVLLADAARCLTEFQTPG